MGTLSGWGCPGQSTTRLGSVTIRGLVGKSNTTTIECKEKETQPESSQHPAENAVGKLMPSNFMFKDFPFAPGGGGCMRERTMLCLNRAVAARDGGAESKAPAPPTPQPFQNKQAWEIIVNVKGIKKASACVCVCVCMRV